MATLLGLSLPAILGGALITEAVFNYPGMGYLLYQAAERQDYPILLGLTVVGSLATVVGSLLADVAYAVSTPASGTWSQPDPACRHAAVPGGRARAQARCAPDRRAMLVPWCRSDQWC
jgi:hypothetical protein